MSATEKNLQEAFAGESQANRKYLAFADKAEKEGHKQVARLFRAVAHAETIHAHAHLRALKGIGDTAANLKEALSGEIHEFKSMYPPMIETARQEGNKNAERSFTYANEVEEIHAALYQKALDTLDKPTEADFHVCSVCGYTCEGEAPGKCPVCGASSNAFVKID
ncbi:MAG TPA: rubrerythrin [Desulfobulbaceae bacterium]|nr:rubrerythrin [Desulfobulbaceae bacterium]